MCAAMVPRPAEYEWFSAPARVMHQDRSGTLDMAFWER